MITLLSFGTQSAPALESYDTPGQYAWANATQAKRYASAHMQALEAQHQAGARPSQRQRNSVYLEAVAFFDHAHRCGRVDSGCGETGLFTSERK